jgi:hypothetical protein
MHWRSRSAIAARSVHRHALTDEPRQFGKWVVSLSARLLGAAPTRIPIRTLIVFSHETRPVQPFTGDITPRNIDP